MELRLGEDTTWGSERGFRYSQSYATQASQSTTHFSLPEQLESVEKELNASLIHLPASHLSFLFPRSGGSSRW